MGKATCYGLDVKGFYPRLEGRNAPLQTGTETLVKLVAVLLPEGKAVEAWRSQLALL